MEYSDSLKKTQDFQLVYRKGTSVANRCLVMYVLYNQSKENRLGIQVSKKVGNSVVRHRITRLIRESYRLNERQFRRGIDIVVIARSFAKGASFWDIQAAFLSLGKKLHVYDKNWQEG